MNSRIGRLEIRWNRAELMRQFRESAVGVVLGAALIWYLPHVFPTSSSGTITFVQTIFGLALVANLALGLTAALRLTSRRPQVVLDEVGAFPSRVSLMRECSWGEVEVGPVVPREVLRVIGPVHRVTDPHFYLNRRRGFPTERLRVSHRDFEYVESVRSDAAQLRKAGRARVR